MASNEENKSVVNELEAKIIEQIEVFLLSIIFQFILINKKYLFVVV